MEANINEDDTNFHHVQPHIVPPSLDDIQRLPQEAFKVLRSLRGIKANKAPGQDGITTEINKCGGKYLKKEIRRLTTSAQEKERIPDKWKVAMIIPVHKKEDKQV